MSERDIQKKFFYAGDEAEIYDEIAGLTMKDYYTLHNTVLELLQFHFKNEKPKDPSDTGWLLDVGCGTGIEAIGFLRAFPEKQIIALDQSSKMLQQLKNKLQKEPDNLKMPQRCIPSLMDITDQKRATPQALKDLLPENKRETGYQAVITVFALHHYTAEEKLRIYKTFYEILEPGGLLINGDLFSYHSKALAIQAQNHIENYLTEQVQSPSPEYQQTVNKLLGDQKEVFLKKWLEHLRVDNIPLPVDKPCISTASKESAVPNELDLLNAAGFRQVECPYRYFQGGILWAVK